MSKLVPYSKVAGSNWQIWRASDGGYTEQQIHTALLMDIRTELVKLNRVMQCPNVAAGFRALASIARDEKRFKARVAAAVRRELKKRGK